MMVEDNVLPIIGSSLWDSKIFRELKQSSNLEIGHYEYVYGPGNTSNRLIRFYGDGQKVWCEVYGKTRNILTDILPEPHYVWAKIEDIDETNIMMEGASISEKIKIMKAARETEVDPVYPPDQPFDKISYGEKVRIVENLQTSSVDKPIGNYRICIDSYLGSNPRFEQIRTLLFFDPY
ncbi:Hypothetical protein HVR_LOCUS867 [uncultured virus]|nr:Hypothetical protein HVR_LOCUS867 [uncultured virus]